MAGGFRQGGCSRNGGNMMSNGMEFQVMMLAVGLYFAALGNET